MEDQNRQRNLQRKARRARLREALQKEEEEKKYDLKEGQMTQRGSSSYSISGEEGKPTISNLQEMIQKIWMTRAPMETDWSWIPEPPLPTEDDEVNPDSPYLIKTQENFNTLALHKIQTQRQSSALLATCPCCKGQRKTYIQQDALPLDYATILVVSSVRCRICNNILIYDVMGQHPGANGGKVFSITAEDLVVPPVPSGWKPSEGGQQIAKIG